MKCTCEQVLGVVFVCPRPESNTSHAHLCLSQLCFLQSLLLQLLHKAASHQAVLAGKLYVQLAQSYSLSLLVSACASEQLSLVLREVHAAWEDQNRENQNSLYRTNPLRETTSHTLDKLGFLRPKGFIPEVMWHSCTVQVSFCFLTDFSKLGIFEQLFQQSSHEFPQL